MKKKIISIIKFLILINFIIISVTNCGKNEEEANVRGIGNQRGDKAIPGEDTTKTQANQAIQPGGTETTDCSELEANLPPLNLTPLTNDSFIESDIQRDPFKPYFLYSLPLANMTNLEDIALPRKVMASQYDLTQLNLIGIISQPSGIDGKAVLVDPDGKEWIVKRGDYIGKGELITAGLGGVGREIQINWRVSRIEPSKSYVMFERYDPTSVDNAPPVIKIMKLHPEEDLREEL